VPYAQRMRIGKNPPQFNVSPRVRCWVSLQAGQAPLTPFLVTPAVVFAADQTSYGTSSVRYTTMRFIALRCWACSSTTSTNPALTISDSNSGMIFQDTGTIGGTNAAVAYMYPLTVRSVLEAPANTTTYSSVAYGGGLLTLQVLVDFA
jgi:hypothetical protein